MNKVQLMGRFTKDPETKQCGDSGQVVRFTLAVDRKPSKSGDKPEADFISCVAFGKTAEFIGKFFHKGERILLCGHIQTGSYDKNGQKIYTTDVVVDEAEFVEKKEAGTPAQNTQAAPPQQYPNPNSYQGYMGACPPQFGFPPQGPYPGYPQQ